MEGGEIRKEGNDKEREERERELPWKHLLLFPEQLEPTMEKVWKKWMSKKELRKHQKKQTTRGREVRKKRGELPWEVFPPFYVHRHTAHEEESLKGESPESSHGSLASF
jgi:hypothetical protein